MHNGDNAMTQFNSQFSLSSFLYNPLATLLLSLVLITGVGLAPHVAAQSVNSVADVASVNINTADEQALADALKGVGASTAREIVRYRELYGPFKSVDELTEVKGIGLATLNKNRGMITLD
jgi:competence protein ComEA